MNKIEIKCPKCDSEDYDCYDESTYDDIHLRRCVCLDCETQFDVKYMAIEIKLD